LGFGFWVETFEQWVQGVGCRVQNCGLGNDALRLKVWDAGHALRTDRRAGRARVFPARSRTRTCDRPCTHYVPTTSGALYYVKGILLPIHLGNNFNGEYALNLKP
jgi:hypothetical protein